eukprot:9292100-Alexandrium_andersonii.AAC.1
MAPPARQRHHSGRPLRGGQSHPRKEAECVGGGPATWAGTGNCRETIFFGQLLKLLETTGSRRKYCCPFVVTHAALADLNISGAQAALTGRQRRAASILVKAARCSGEGSAPAWPLRRQPRINR